MSLQMTLEAKPTIRAVQERRADRDHELVEALRLHEPTAAERLVATYGDRAYRLARGITGNAQDAEEVDAIRSAIRPRSRRPQRARGTHRASQRRRNPPPGVTYPDQGRVDASRSAT